MPTLIFENGLPSTAPASEVINQTLNIIAKAVDNKFPNDINLVLDTTWAFTQESYDLIKQFYIENPRIDNLFLVGTVDIIDDLGILYPDNPNLNVCQIGSINDDFFHPHRIEWSLYSLKTLFANYRDSEIEMIRGTQLKHYICYQNKPHQHRQLLTYRLQQENLLDKGFVTLNQEPGVDYIYPGLQKMSLTEYINPNHMFLPLADQNNPIDQKQVPYGLGDLKYWQNSFLNVVSETHPNTGTTPFISEKTLKPIIGLRPFLINGNYRIVKQLEQRGITMTDIGYQLGIPEHEWYTNDSEKIVENCIETIKALCKLSQQEIYTWYKNLLPLLISNREQLWFWASDQEKIIQNPFRHYTRLKRVYDDPTFIERNREKILQNGINL